MAPAFSPLPALSFHRGTGPRRVANLAFSEILIVWALRRYTARSLSREARAAAVAPEFARAFGLAGLETTLAAFARVADALVRAARLPQAVSLPEDDRVNPTEEALLSVLAALQQGKAAQARALSEWCLLPEGRGGFLTAAGELARAMREAGQMIPYEAPRRLHLALSARADDAPPLPTAGDLASLTAGERGLAAGVRIWVLAFRQQEGPLAAVRDHFDRLFNAEDRHDGSPWGGPLWGDRRSGADAGLSLHAVLRNTTLATTRPVDVRCPACPGLSPDEARLIDAVAWLQRDIAEPASAALGDWLPPAAVRLSLGPARGLAHALLAAEQVLPMREWDLAALESAAQVHNREPAPAEEAQLPATQRSGAPTLH
jgi:hypothetical protein